MTTPTEGVKRYQWCDIDEDQHTGGPLADEWFIPAPIHDATVSRLAAELAEAKLQLDGTSILMRAAFEAKNMMMDERDAALAREKAIREALADLHFDGVVWPMCSHDISKVHVPLYLWNKLRTAYAALAAGGEK
jgi:hypothetical protein